MRCASLEYDGGVEPVVSGGGRRRDRELDRLGIRVLRFTAEELRDPDEVLAGVADALTRRAIELGVAAPSVDPARRR